MLELFEAAASEMGLLSRAAAEHTQRLDGLVNDRDVLLERMEAQAALRAIDAEHIMRAESRIDGLTADRDALADRMDGVDARLFRDEVRIRAVELALRNLPAPPVTDPPAPEQGASPPDGSPILSPHDLHVKVTLVAEDVRMGSLEWDALYDIANSHRALVAERDAFREQTSRLATWLLEHDLGPESSVGAVDCAIQRLGALAAKLASAEQYAADCDRRIRGGLAKLNYFLAYRSPSTLVDVAVDLLRGEEVAG